METQFRWMVYYRRHGMVLPGQGQGLDYYLDVIEVED
jgi:hypothetical protein